MRTEDPGTTGSWLDHQIAQGNEPPSISGLLNKEMCGTFCFMAGSPENAHLNWTGANKKWIDPADYDRLVEKLQEQPDPEIIFISGMISWDDQLYLSSLQHISEGIPDRIRVSAPMFIRFLDNTGKTLNEVGFPVNWKSADIIARPRPVTFFAFNVEFHAGAREYKSSTGCQPEYSEAEALVQTSLGLR